ncbi:MAG TPA: BTAD domain-containing putative transcriptional regulator [Solirubrobacteraceae bacterium]|nr:BTAD domain-containing putative transcriptional regulator [Solirubrobacteraceae bacterium]
MSRFRVLGPIEVRTDETRLALGGPQQVKLLAFLLLNANRAVSSDAVIDAVWGTEREGAAKRLQMAVLRLRKALEPLDGHDGPRLRTVRGGYLLSVDPGELDAERFADNLHDGRRALELGDPRRASEVLTEALALWRGPPMAEVIFEDFAQAEVRRLEELRLVALESRIDADLELGRHVVMVAELEGLLARQPMRERLTRQLMLALYRSGRQADALEIYQRTRTHLANELGLEPGPALKALQSQILEQDPALDTTEQPNVATEAGTEHDEPADIRPDPRSFGRSNLPTPATSLIGRSEETSRALELLAGREVRLLTLWGPAGAGKTRLALEVAAASAGSYRDGVWIVPLAPIPDRALLVAEVSRVLEVAPVSGEPPERALLSALAGRELLLVLDNFEHLLDAAAVVADLLTAAPRVDVLATSREPLRIRGEQRMEVPPLPPPEAAELFVARARAVRPDLTVDQDDRAAIERICDRLDGLPLALELAAARIAVFGPRQLESRLAERLALPEGPRDLPERQRTLRATIGWSYQLLGPAERRLLARLSPFIGGVRIDAAESIWGAGAEEELISLAEKSLLRRREDPDGAPRLWMLETVRAFALERATADGVIGEAIDRHAEHCFALAEQAASYLHGRDEREWLDRLESEHANLRAALDHLSAHEPGQALRLAGRLIWFWELRGFRIEARDRLTEVLASTGPDEPGRGRALVGAGRLASRAGDFAMAESLLLEALPITRQKRDQRLTVLALSALGWDAGAMGDESEMAARYEEAIATARAAADDWALGLALNGYSSCGPVRADPERARPMVEEALSLFRRIGDAAGIAHAASTLAEIAMDAGDLEVAERLISESIESAREIDNRPALGFGLLFRSIVSLLRDDAEGADARLQAALQMSTPYDDSNMAADTLSAAATIVAMRREPHRAAMLWAAAETVRGSAHEHEALARLRGRWQPHAQAELSDQASWEAATRAGAELTLEEALALAAGSHPDRGERGTQT